MVSAVGHVVSPQHGHDHPDRPGRGGLAGLVGRIRRCDQGRIATAVLAGVRTVGGREGSQRVGAGPPHRGFGQHRGELTRHQRGQRPAQSRQPVDMLVRLGIATPTWPASAARVNRSQPTSSARSAALATTESAGQSCSRHVRRPWPRRSEVVGDRGS